MASVMRTGRAQSLAHTEIYDSGRSGLSMLREESNVVRLIETTATSQLLRK